jgi:DNA-binding winged helix-turn-helix (wHTH) protein/tetratricopeptide (TPR) repeat protein/TolB-like protein
MLSEQTRLYEFGSFRLDPAERTLFRDDEPVPLPPRLFDTLCALVERSGHLVEKDALMTRVWQDAFVEEGSLTRAVSRLRQVLGAQEDGTPYIETIPRVGYRFVANVRTVRQVDSDLILEEHVGSRISIEHSEAPVALLKSLAPTTEEVSTPARPTPAIEAPPRRRTGTVALLVVAPVLLAVAGYTIARLSGTGGSRASSPPPRAVAVLPLRPVGPSPTNGEFGSMVTAELTSRLGRLSHVVVRPPPPAPSAASPDPIRSGKDVKADWVLVGTTREATDHAELSMRLLDVADGRALWSQDFRCGPGDSQDAANTISIGLANALAPKISVRDRETLEEPQAEPPDAYQLVMKGRLAMSRGGKGLLSSGDYFQLAIEKDPHYALAYSSLAAFYSALYENMVVNYAESAVEARRNALKAVELDGVSGDAHLALAEVHGLFDWDWAGADREYRRAVELRPNDAIVHASLGEFYDELGRLDDSLRELRIARELNPVSPWIPALMGEALRRAGRNDQAVEELQRAISMDPALGAPHYILGMVYQGRGMYETAIAEFLRCLDAYGVRETAAIVRKANEEGGPMNAYRAWLARSEMSRDIKAVLIAQIYEVLGQPDRALDALEFGVAERAPWIYSIGAEPGFANLHSQRRFQELLRKMNVPARSL